MIENSAGRALMERARAFLGLSLKHAQGALGTGARVVPGDEYGRLSDVTSLESEDVFPGTLYVEGDEVRIVRISRSGLQGVTSSALRAEMEGDPIRLRSRAAKRAQLLVYASQGIAFSSQGEELDFLEVFSPCTQAEYEAWYYRPPGAFIR